MTSSTSDSTKSFSSSSSSEDKNSSLQSMLLQLKQSFQSLDRRKKLQMLEVLAAKARHLSQHRISTYFETEEVRASYPKQMEWFKLGRFNQETALFGGNRSGKAAAGTYADTCHLTGQYPAWWNGYRFDRPTQGWAA